MPDAAAHGRRRLGMSDSRGIVYLVGAGPGDPGLITVAGLGLLRQADVVVYDRLIGRDLLSVARSDAELIDVGKAAGQTRITQDEINAILVDRGLRGLTVVRLKGGDPFVFGRGFEELTACREAGVRCYVVSGVSSALAAPAAAGIPVTRREIGRSVAIVTGSVLGDRGAIPLDFEALARLDTVVVLMGRANLAELATSMIRAGRDRTTPVACIERAATNRQRVVRGTLATIAYDADRIGIAAPLVVVIGSVAAEALIDGSSLFPFIGTEQSTKPQPAAASVLRATPLAGRRIVITRPRSRSSALRRLLEAHGATVIECPLIEISYPEANPVLDDAIQRLANYDWIIFTSAHGVTGFWQRMVQSDRDARDLGRCRLAAIGPATAQALRRRGLRADLTPAGNTAAALADGLVRDPTSPPRVLWPRGDLAPSTLADKLRSAGITVDDLIAYQTRPVTPRVDALRALRQGVDAALFFSPSAVHRYHELESDGAALVVACIGPSTAEAARSSGMTVQVVPGSPDVHSFVEALRDWFARHAPRP